MIFLRHSIRQAELFGLETGAKLFQRERLAEFVHDPAREFAGQSQFRKFPPEQRLLVPRVRDLARLGEEASGGTHLDLMIGMDDAGSKSDGGNVPFPGGAQAENKPQSAGWQIGLVRVRNDGWIEQGSGFQGVFGQKIGADQQSPLFGQVLILRQPLADLFEAFQKELADLLVPLGEVGADLVQERTDLVFRERHDPGDDPADPLGTARIEWPQKNA